MSANRFTFRSLEEIKKDFETTDWLHSFTAKKFINSSQITDWQTLAEYFWYALENNHKDLGLIFSRMLCAKKMTYHQQSRSLSSELRALSEKELRTEVKPFLSELIKEKHYPALQRLLDEVKPTQNYRKTLQEFLLVIDPSFVIPEPKEVEKKPTSEASVLLINGEDIQAESPRTPTRNRAVTVFAKGKDIQPPKAPEEQKKTLVNSEEIAKLSGSIVVNETLNTPTQRNRSASLHVKLETPSSNPARFQFATKTSEQQSQQDFNKKENVCLRK